MINDSKQTFQCVIYYIPTTYIILYIIIILFKYRTDFTDYTSLHILSICLTITQ